MPSLRSSCVPSSLSPPLSDCMAELRRRGRWRPRRPATGPPAAPAATGAASKRASRHHGRQRLVERRPRRCRPARSHLRYSTERATPASDAAPTASPSPARPGACDRRGSATNAPSPRRPARPPPADDVVAADEAGDEGRAGSLNTSRGGAGLLDPAVVHHHDEVGQRHRLVLAVGDVDEGDAELASAASSAPRACGSRRNGSSADSGSSSSSTCGSVISARASATRCCWPPESCAGSRVGVGLHLHALRACSSACARRVVLVDAAHLQAEGDVVDADRDAGTARRSGTSSPCRAPPAAGR